MHTHTDTHTNRVQWDALRSILYVPSLPGKRKVAVAGRLAAPDRYRSAFTAVCGCLFSTVILSFTELSSFVVHLLCCVGSVNLISSLFSPITNSQLSFARASTVCRLVLSSYCLSNLIRQAHLWAGWTDLMKACDLQSKSDLHAHITHAAYFETIWDCTDTQITPPPPPRNCTHSHMV